MTTRVLVVGADATGMSAASQALRRAGRNGLTVMALERGHHASYSACGIPYWVAGDGVQTLDDGAAVLDGLTGSPRQAVVVGGGYIGIEMAEAMIRRGLAVTVVDQAPEPMPTLDPDMGALVREAMRGMGIEVLAG